MGRLVYFVLVGVGLGILLVLDGIVLAFRGVRVTFIRRLRVVVVGLRIGRIVYIYGHGVLGRYVSVYCCCFFCWVVGNYCGGLLHIRLV